MKDKKKFYWFLAITIFPFIIYLFLIFSKSTEKKSETELVTNINESIENDLIDIRHKYFNPNFKFSDKIIILDFDEDTLKANKLGTRKEYGRWPWRREAYKSLLEFINLGSPSLILFDIMFTEEFTTDDGVGDKVLGEVTRNFGNISHAVLFSNDVLYVNTQEEIRKSIPDFVRQNSMQKLDPVEFELKVFNNLDLPIKNIISSIDSKTKQLQTLNHLHSVSYFQDSDGVARRISLVFNYEDIYIPSLALKGYQSLYPVKEFKKNGSELILTSDEKITKIPLEKGRMRLNYYSEKEIENIPRLPVGDSILSYEVITGKRELKDKKGQVVQFNDMSQLDVNPADFAGRVVLVGTSAAATHDDKLTPYGSKPGVLLHAVGLSNLIEGHFLDLAPIYMEWIILLITIPVCVYLTFYFQAMILRTVLPILIFVGTTFLGLFLFKLNIHFPLSGFITTYPIALLGAIAYLSFTEGAERRKYSKVLSNMVDPSIVSEALNDLEALKKGGEKEITAFFSDVAGFSTISEQLSSADLAALLNEYLSAMTIILKQNKGTLDKYIGDAVVGIFSAPIHSDSHHLESAKASIDMIAKLADLKKYWSDNNLYIKDAQEMEVRIGLNTGVAKVGFMGTDALASYTMMGDTVNLAARLEAAGKDYGVNILISESTNVKIKDKFFTKKLDAVRVKGKTEPVNIYELIAVRGEESEKINKSSALYEEAFELHLQKKFDEAIKKFKESIEARGKKDKAANMLIDRCEEYKLSPPPENWDGAYTRTHK